MFLHIQVYFFHSSVEPAVPKTTTMYPLNIGKPGIDSTSDCPVHIFYTRTEYADVFLKQLNGRKSNYCIRILSHKSENPWSRNSVGTIERVDNELTIRGNFIYYIIIETLFLNQDIDVLRVVSTNVDPFNRNKTTFQSAAPLTRLRKLEVVFPPYTDYHNTSLQSISPDKQGHISYWSLLAADCIINNLAEILLVHVIDIKLSYLEYFGELMRKNRFTLEHVSLSLAHPKTNFLSLFFGKIHSVLSKVTHLQVDGLRGESVFFNAAKANSSCVTISCIFPHLSMLDIKRVSDEDVSILFELKKLREVTLNIATNKKIFNITWFIQGFYNLKTANLEIEFINKIDCEILGNQNSHKSVTVVIHSNCGHLQSSDTDIMPVQTHT